MNEIAVVTKSPMEILEIAKSFVEVLDDGTIRDNFTKTNDKGEKVFSKSDAIATMALGMEIGLNPITSLSIGKDLKPSKIYAIDKGRAMGLSALESIKSIHTIANKDGQITLKVSVDLIARQLLKAGVNFELTKDYTPVYAYEVKVGEKFVPADTDRIEDNYGNILPKFFLIDPTVTQEEVDNAKKEKKVFITRKVIDYVTEWLFSRVTGTNIQKYNSAYYRSEAVKAGFLRVVNSKGEVIQEGKSNWNTYEKQMMRNISLSLGGRKIAADAIIGVYEENEVFEEIQEAKIIE